MTTTGPTIHLETPGLLRARELLLDRLASHRAVAAQLAEAVEALETLINLEDADA